MVDRCYALLFYLTSNKCDLEKKKNFINRAKLRLLKNSLQFIDSNILKSRYTSTKFRLLLTSIKNF